MGTANPITAYNAGWRVQFRFAVGVFWSGVYEYLMLAEYHTMKRAIITILTATTIYAMGYGVVRLCFGESGTKTFTDSQGIHHELHLKGTHFILPGSGFPRLSKQALYWGFYPLGWVDNKMNGRGYGCVDGYSMKYYGL